MLYFIIFFLYLQFKQTDFFRQMLALMNIIDYIETHLGGKLKPDTVASAVHYSKYHLHRMFTHNVGITIHDYVLLRQLTEAPKLLVFSGKPVIEIALMCGYESQQVFTASCSSIYNVPPGEYRKKQEFYPLQPQFIMLENTSTGKLLRQNVRLADRNDIPSWKGLVHLVIDGFLHLDENGYLQKLTVFIWKMLTKCLFRGL